MKKFEAITGFTVSMNSTFYEYINIFSEKIFTVIYCRKHDPHMQNFRSTLLSMITCRKNEIDSRVEIKYQVGRSSMN